MYNGRVVGRLVYPVYPGSLLGPWEALCATVMTLFYGSLGGFLCNIDASLWVSGRLRATLMNGSMVSGSVSVQHC